MYILSFCGFCRMLSKFGHYFVRSHLSATDSTKIYKIYLLSQYILENEMVKQNVFDFLDLDVGVVRNNAPVHLELLHTSIEV